MSARFALGALLQTPGVAELVPPERVRACLRQHAAGDWGEVDEEDRDANDAALRDGTRLLSVYAIDPTQPGSGKFWIITEADRSTTTVLLPDEY